jgi:hypothetical protein
MAFLLLMLTLLLPDSYAKDLLYAESWKSSYPQPAIKTITPERIEKLEQSIRPITQSCLAGLEERLGRPWPRKKDGSPKRLKIKLERDSELFEGAAETSGMFFIGIKLKILPFINGTTNFEKTLCHEIVHAYYRYHMSYFKYAKVPRWLREGSAVYLAQQTFEKEKVFMLKHANPATFQFNGLEGQHTFEDYYEDALSFHAMDARDSQRGADKFLTLILAGKSVEDSLKTLWSLDKTTFLNESKAFAQERIQEKVAAEINPEFFVIKQKLAKGEIRHQQAFDFFLRELLARGLDLGRPESYLPLIEDLYTNLLLKSVLANLNFSTLGEKAVRFVEYLLLQEHQIYLNSERAQLRYILSGLYEKQLRWQDALMQNMAIFHEHPEGAMLQRLIPLAIAESYFGLQDWREVLRWGKDRESYHVSNRLELKLFRAIAHYHLSQEKEAFKLLRELNGMDKLPIKQRLQLQEFLQQQNLHL